MNALKIFVTFMVVGIAFVAAAPGSIIVRNTGGYVAKFTVSYDHNGRRANVGSGDFSAGVNKEVSIPDGARNISVKVEEYWFPGKLSTIFSKTYDSPTRKCFKIWGTTLIPKWSEERC